ncbi:MAG: hypothetical protein H6622_16185 [Halobacteriovoraceae bacterium]|nr:hypothetical protein [Halobacteriovoraceae bacterium]
MHNLPELKKILELKSFQNDLISTDNLGIIKHKKRDYPIVSFVIGPKDKCVPTFGLFGGVHGLERVGTHVVINYLTSLFQQLTWDMELRNFFKNFRFVSIPLINPAGMATYQRSNPNGVDIMRNSPVDSIDEGTPFISGHRISNLIPWYRGEKGIIESETQLVIDFVTKYLFNSPASISLDVHSGFGMVDRIWYPYAKTSSDFPRKKESLVISELLDRTIPHHVYKFESQADSYIISGDLWDHLFDLHYNDPQNENSVYIPFTLEMGSWNWVRKNPSQIFSLLGMFNPMKRHRHSRTMRRHLLLLDYLLRVTKNYPAWFQKTTIVGDGQ